MDEGSLLHKGSILHESTKKNLKINKTKKKLKKLKKYLPRVRGKCDSKKKILLRKIKKPTKVRIRGKIDLEKSKIIVTAGEVSKG